MLVNKMICWLLMCSLIFLTACWDQVAIEERGFVIGISLDEGEDGDQYGENNYNLDVTTQVVVPAGLGSPGQGGGGGQQKAFTNISGSGASMFEASRKVAREASHIPFYEHLKVLIVSEKIATDENLFASIMDIFIRDQEMRRSIKLIISDGEAKPLLEIEPEEDSLPAMYIDSVVENNSKSIEIVDPVDMGNIHEFLLNRSSFVVPRLVPEENKLLSSGVAVFHGYNNKMVGILTGKETKGLNLITNKNTGGSIDFDIDDHLMIFELQNTNPTIKIDAKDKDHINISIDIDAEGSVAEMFGSQTLLTPKRIKNIEKHVSKKIEQLVTQTLNKAQNELNADIFGFKDRLKQRHYDLWKMIRDNWDRGDNYFAKANITVSASAVVRATGATDKTKSNGNG